LGCRPVSYGLDSHAYFLFVFRMARRPFPLDNRGRYPVFVPWRISVVFHNCSDWFARVGVGGVLNLEANVSVQCQKFQDATRLRLILAFRQTRLAIDRLRLGQSKNQGSRTGHPTNCYLNSLGNFLEFCPKSD